MTLFLFTILLLVSFLGSYIGVGVKNQSIHWLYGLVPGALATIIWALMTRYCDIKLAELTGWFNALLMVGYFLGYVYFGESMSAKQVVALVFLAVGVYLIN